MANYPELKDRVAIVTGGARGMGVAISRAFGAQGCRVAINARKETDAAKALRDEINQGGGQAKIFLADVRYTNQALKLIEEVKADFGGLDFLVNNAGINRDRVVWKMADEDWDSVIATNLTGYFHTIRAVAAIFREQKSGRIVNITSINGMRGKFGQSNYAASKAGIIGLTKSVARELGRAGVTVNAVAPGLIETEMIAEMPEDAKAASLGETVLGRLGTPEDIAETVLFLCSDGARHITGEVIKVDGGQYI
ncbi:MAG TPA: 3-oxoacyl-ACP reductase FabG [Acidobacteriota bacterium]|nr:3-oxoacyl-ACP reductase FabG [Acidobacteriota bacterium]